MDNKFVFPALRDNTLEVGWSLEVNFYKQVWGYKIYIKCKIKMEIKNSSNGKNLQILIYGICEQVHKNVQVTHVFKDNLNCSILQAIPRLCTFKIK